MTQVPLLETSAAIGRDLAAALQEILSTRRWSEVPAAMDEHLSRLAALECWGEENPVPSSVFWREAGELLRRGSLQAHARFKPHGYAGDHEMLERLVTEDARGDGLALAFDRYFQDHPAPRAVRNRTRWVADRIQWLLEQREGPLRVVSVGSGPAADIWLAVQQLADEQQQRLQVTLLDLDANALEFAATRLRTRLAAGQVVAQRENLFRLPRRRSAPPLAADLVFCTGLFDYLADGDAIEMLRWMERQRADGGEWVMMNFSPRNGSRAYMEWAGNWYLIHRTEEAMESLARQAGFERGWRLTEEDERIDLILHRT